eukprot:Protomagalhaensia_wolfi_Nauph_80__2381@NODE_2566_length_1051_cov_223_437747_g2008_i0_p1_GENE_NODE_2566_length_1051_cov_223_437747_g2008_i0NODE_2566_length_1051_cov_223_437747_g2008_i0_p1_ORF_typecomplete_len176_score9_24_NODE_2566_length_1051_cov_223_437747_g2008_i072599
MFHFVVEEGQLDCSSLGSQWSRVLAGLCSVYFLDDHYEYRETADFVIDNEVDPGNVALILKPDGVEGILFRCRIRNDSGNHFWVLNEKSFQGHGTLLKALKTLGVQQEGSDQKKSKAPFLRRLKDSASYLVGRRSQKIACNPTRRKNVGSNLVLELKKNSRTEGLTIRESLEYRR